MWLGAVSLPQDYPDKILGTENPTLGSYKHLVQRSWKQMPVEIPIGIPIGFSINRIRQDSSMTISPKSYHDPTRISKNSLKESYSILLRSHTVGRSIWIVAKREMTKPT